MNDPNGLVWHKGEYHLFFQYNPFGTKWGHMSWGHAVSKDLINWEELPVAIAEGEEGMIFSGSAVSVGDEIIAIYTMHTEHNQSQCIAISIDNGRTFTKFEGNPVLDLGLQHFRDPKVFRYNDRWIMAVVKAEERTVCFFSSPDLITWGFESEFGKVGATGGQWECPDLFPLSIDGEQVWVLIISLNPGGLHGSGTQYFIGDFDGKNFTPRYSTDEPRWLDYGSDNYAGVTFNNEPNNKRIFIGWLANWSNLQAHPETSWSNQMTTPRELGLIKYKDEIVLTQKPINEVLYELKVKAPTSGTIGLRGFVTVGYNADEKKVFVNEYAAPYDPIEAELHLRIVVDQSSVELFTADGVRSISLALFPPEGATRKLTAFRS